MTIDQSTLTKGQIRKLNALRKSVGDDIAEGAFGKWMKTQSKTPKDVRDPVADALVAELSNLQNDKSFKFENRDTSFVVRRVEVSQGLLLRRLSEETSTPEPIAIWSCPGKAEGLLIT